MRQARPMWASVSRQQSGIPPPSHQQKSEPAGGGRTRGIKADNGAVVDRTLLTSPKCSEPGRLGLPCRAEKEMPGPAGVIIAGQDPARSGHVPVTNPAADGAPGLSGQGPALSLKPYLRQKSGNSGSVGKGCAANLVVGLPALPGLVWSAWDPKFGPGYPWPGADVWGR